VNKVPSDVKTEVPGEDQFRIVEVGLDSPFLEAVIKLYASIRGRLGPFPRGAFEDHAARKRILAAITSDNAVAGYLLYRIAKHRAAIVHLAIGHNFRGQGIARLLVDCLKGRTRHLLGISLRCRRDYNLNDMWQAFHFTVRHSREGRGADGALLDFWWFDHNHDDLFSQAAARDDASERALTVIDANIFFDLTCPRRPHSEDTKVLQADWLEDSIVLCITPEIYNEIHRAKTEKEKERGRIAAQRFRELKTQDEEVQALEKELAPVFNGATFERDISDMRQVAHAIAAEVPFLVTRDTPMLGRSDVIFETYGLRILHPTDLVNRLDILRREAEYRPVRLEGSNWRQRLVVADDVQTIASLFKCKNERSGNFENRARHHLVKPDEWASMVTVAGERTPTIYLVHSKGNACRLEIPLLRHAEQPPPGSSSAPPHPRARLSLHEVPDRRCSIRLGS